MKNILVAGAGRIGSLISCLLAGSNDYKIYLIDSNMENAEIKRLGKDIPHLVLTEMNIQDQAGMINYVKENKIEAIVSSLPFFCNVMLAELACSLNLHYFDLTEDTAVTAAIKNLGQSTPAALVPQCGLAPGFIGIVANSLIKEFDFVEKVKMRVGALPAHASNALKYALTWSTDGLINEYGNPAFAIVDKEVIKVKSLGDLETIELDGNLYEAFNTSGGLGSLVELYTGKIKSMDYKTIRYPGHCEKMRFLMWDLKLNDDRATLKQILERAIPKTHQDVVIIYVAVTGSKKGDFNEAHYVNKVYPITIADTKWSAIQVSTAASLCAVVDIVLENPEKYHGFIYQEEIPLNKFLKNRFGHYLAKEEIK